MYFFKPEREEGVDLTSSDTESLNAQACHQPRQNQAEDGTAKIIFNPAEVRQEMGQPVLTNADRRNPHTDNHQPCHQLLQA